MDYKKLLNMKRELKPFHKFNLFNRILKKTNGDILVVFNNFSGMYEVHSVRSQMLTDDSKNAAFRTDEYLNGYLLHDIGARNIKKFGVDIESEHMRINAIYDKHEEQTHTERSLDAGVKSVERVLGRKI
jgi:hypothetical protein